MELLEADLANSRSENDIAQTCITRGNDLLATYKNAVQELIAERQSTVELFQYQHFPNAEAINCQVSHFYQHLVKLEGEVDFLKLRLYKKTQVSEDDPWK